MSGELEYQKKEKDDAERCNRVLLQSLYYSSRFIAYIYVYVVTHLSIPEITTENTSVEKNRFRGEPPMNEFVLKNT